MPLTIPQMSVPQHMTALAEANRVRICRAQLRREVFEERDSRSSRERLAMLLESPPDEITTLRILDFVAWGRRTGHKNARRLLRRAKLREGTRIGGLTVRQRRALAGVLRGGEG